MSQIVNLSSETFTRLQAHAVPLVDTIETVINKALDAFEANGSTPKNASAGVRVFSPDTPPNLSYTTVKSAEVCGKRHIPSETYWNSVLNAAIREAGRRGIGPEAIKNLVIVNSVLGKKEDGGYKFIEEAGISVQGQDANAAWKAAYHIAKELGFSIEVTFVWQENPKAVSPGVTGSFSVKGR